MVLILLTSLKLVLASLFQLIRETAIFIAMDTALYSPNLSKNNFSILHHLASM